MGAERHFVDMVDDQHMTPVFIHRTPVARGAIAVGRRELRAIRPNSVGHVMRPRVRKMGRQTVAITFLEVNLKGVVLGCTPVCAVTDVGNRWINKEKWTPGPCRSQTGSWEIGILRIHHMIGPRSDVRHIDYEFMTQFALYFSATVNVLI